MPKQLFLRPVAAAAASAAASAVAALLLVPAGASAQTLYSEDFDTDSTAEWSVNQPTGGFASDNAANFFFDYSTVGIPAAD